MSRFSFFGLLLFVLGILQAQPVDFQPLLELNPSITDSTAIHVLQGEGEITLIFLEETEAQIFVLSSDMDLRNSFRLSDLPLPEEYTFLGFTDMPGSLHFCYQHQTDGAYEVLSVEKETGEPEWFGIDMGRLPRHSVYWGSFTHEGILHILRMPRGGSSVRLCRFEGGQQFNTQEFELGHPEILQKAQYHFARVEADSSQGLESTWYPGKMYLKDDRIYLSLDELGSTHLVEINLLSEEKKEWTLPAPGFSLGRDELISVKNNSLILGNYLYQAAASQDSLKIEVRSLREDQLIMAYAVGIEDSTAFFRGDFVAQNSRGETILLEDTQSWLDTLAGHPYLALSGTVIQDTLLELQIGGVKLDHQLGLTGMLVDQQINNCYFSIVLSIPSHTPASLPHADVAEMRFPPPIFWGKPHLTGFANQQQKHLMYYDPEIQRIVLGSIH
ncbi:MAG: hypothetical protein AAF587_09515 [Bacteroidota bacterium]